MFDIEKQLNELGRKKHRPDESLRQRTLDKLRGQTRVAAPRKVHALHIAAIPAAAAVLVAILLLILLPDVQTTSYYTIDINPSISIEADANGVIISAKAQNGDAEALLADLNLTGMPFIDALRQVVQTAEEQGYLKDNGHVLVAHFGISTQVTEQEIETAVLSSTHKQVNVLLLESDTNEYREAEKQHQSAGISLLMKNAQRLGIDETDIDTIIKTVKKNNRSNNGGDSPKDEHTTPVATDTASSSSSHGNNGVGSNQGNSSNNGNSENHGDNSNNNNQGNNSNSGNNGNSGNGGSNGHSGNNGNNGNSGHSDKEDKSNGGDNKD